jgi:phosphoribosylaminoimidazole-succinocarboxamide synthase
MSKQAIEFLESWIDQHVSYAEKGGDSTRATTLADMCRGAAATLGISFDDIKPEFGTVETIIHEAMHYAVGTSED